MATYTGQTTTISGLFLREFCSIHKRLLQEFSYAFPVFFCPSLQSVCSRFDPQARNLKIGISSLFRRKYKPTGQVLIVYHRMQLFPPPVSPLQIQSHFFFPFFQMLDRFEGTASSKGGLKGGCSKPGTLISEGRVNCLLSPFLASGPRILNKKITSLSRSSHIRMGLQAHRSRGGGTTGVPFPPRVGMISCCRTSPDERQARTHKPLFLRRNGTSPGEFRCRIGLLSFSVTSFGPLFFQWRHSFTYALCAYYPIPFNTHHPIPCQTMSYQTIQTKLNKNIPNHTNHTIPHHAVPYN